MPKQALEQTSGQISGAGNLSRRLFQHSFRHSFLQVDRDYPVELFHWHGFWFE